MILSRRSDVFGFQLTRTARRFSLTLQLGLLRSFRKEPVPCEPQTPRGWELLWLQNGWEGLIYGRSHTMSCGAARARGFPPNPWERSELERLQVGSVWFYIPAFTGSAGEGTAWFLKIYDVGSFEKMFLCCFFSFFLLCKRLPSACQC